jgi:hypothetical protein
VRHESAFFQKKGALMAVTLSIHCAVTVSSYLTLPKPGINENEIKFEIPTGGGDKSRYFLKKRILIFSDYIVSSNIIYVITLYLNEICIFGAGI